MSISAEFIGSAFVMGLAGSLHCHYLYLTAAHYQEFQEA
jgi:ABC-type branched-subunit amino acid transport system permease subunit